MTDTNFIPDPSLIGLVKALKNTSNSNEVIKATLTNQNWDPEQVEFALRNYNKFDATKEIYNPVKIEEDNLILLQTVVLVEMVNQANKNIDFVNEGMDVERMIINTTFRKLFNSIVNNYSNLAMTLKEDVIKGNKSTITNKEAYMIFNSINETIKLYGEISGMEKLNAYVNECLSKYSKYASNIIQLIESLNSYSKLDSANKDEYSILSEQLDEALIKDDNYFVALLEKIFSSKLLENNVWFKPINSIYDSLKESMHDVFKLDIKSEPIKESKDNSIDNNLITEADELESKIETKAEMESDLITNITDSKIIRNITDDLTIKINEVSEMIGDYKSGELININDFLNAFLNELKTALKDTITNPNSDELDIYYSVYKLNSVINAYKVLGNISLINSGDEDVVGAEITDYIHNVITFYKNNIIKCNASKFIVDTKCLYKILGGSGDFRNLYQTVRSQVNDVITKSESEFSQEYSKILQKLKLPYGEIIDSEIDALDRGYTIVNKIKESKTKRIRSLEYKTLSHFSPVIKINEGYIFAINNKNYIYDGNFVSIYNENIKDNTYNKLAESLSFFYQDSDGVFETDLIGEELVYDLVNNKVTFKDEEYDVNEGKDKLILKEAITKEAMVHYSSSAINKVNQIVNLIENNDNIVNIDICKIVEDKQTNSIIATLFNTKNKENTQYIIEENGEITESNYSLMIESLKKKGYDISTSYKKQLYKEGNEKLIRNEKRDNLIKYANTLTEQINKLKGIDSDEASEIRDLINEELTKVEKQIKDSYKE